MYVITPAELKAYTVFPKVKNRTDALLEQDILEAVAEIHEIAGHDFTAPAYSPVPEKVKLATKKLAQYYALLNMDESLMKGLKSEKIGDYSYTAAEVSGSAKPDIRSLLKPFVQVKQGTVRMRMRAI
ncbi:hypothetical protein BTO30_12615 [Domibacillus antri]|uniref:DUF3199 domain-containing protein n=1 Tax=Domibacillus antri TaxID=1714264 RepID=A0A1Q8Q3I2_9BACI|nr:DUF3199 family protein [Domibacillus antri]OLN21855.1 hypothetical protein BTO30_12615 [Domibacillus antri]